MGMIGPNGAGKTTAFNMISGYYEPNEGQVIFDGKDITGLRPDQICKLGVDTYLPGGETISSTQRAG